MFKVEIQRDEQMVILFIFLYLFLLFLNILFLSIFYWPMVDNLPNGKDVFTQDKEPRGKVVVDDVLEGVPVEHHLVPGEGVIRVDGSPLEE